MTTNDQVKMLREIESMLETYAESYEAMARQNKDEPHVHMISVATDIRQNMKSVVLKHIAATERAATQPAGVSGPHKIQVCFDNDGKWFDFPLTRREEALAAGWQVKDFYTLAAPISEDMVETRAKELSDQYKAGHADGWREGREDMADPTGARYSDGAAPSVTEGDAPDFHDDLISRLREYAAEPGYSHGDYADTMREAANVLADRATQPEATVGSEAKGEAAGSIGEDAELLRFLQTFAVAYIDSRLAAAPERSGKAADEVYGYATEHDGQYIAFSKGVPAKIPAPYAAIPLYTRPAGNSIAAPSDDNAWLAAVREEVAKLDKYRLCMSYNDSYFTEPAGTVKRATRNLALLMDRSPFATPAPTGESPSVPEGMQLVPIEPTEAMDKAARDECHRMAGVIDPVVHIWDVMLAAAKESA